MLLCGAMLGRTTATVLTALTILISSADAAQSDGHERSRAYNVALGVNCDHCHVETEWRAATKPTFEFARRMAAMVRGLNAGPLSGRTPISCWSCHRGQPVPARLPRAAWEDVASVQAPAFVGASAEQRLTMSVYAASLGVGCGHCHVTPDWANGSSPRHATARSMAAIFDLIPTFFDPAVRMPRTQCYMCHHGRPSVERAAPAR